MADPEAIRLKSLHNNLNRQKYIPMNKARRLCQMHTGFAWIKDERCIYIEVNDDVANHMGFASQDGMIGKSDRDLPILPVAHTSYEFQLADKHVLRGGNYAKMIELLIVQDRTPVLMVVTKICVISETHRPIGVLGIASLIDYECLPALEAWAEFAPMLRSVQKLVPSALTDAELHVHIMNDHFGLKLPDIIDIRQTNKSTIESQLCSIRTKVGKVKPQYPMDGLLPRLCKACGQDEPQ